MANTSTPKTVYLGLYGLGNLLRTIAEVNLQQKFEEEMGTNNVTVIMDIELAQKIKNFVAAHSPNRRRAMLAHNRDNCDPATDPWCVNFFN
jgi:hypothetical protein